MSRPGTRSTLTIKEATRDDQEPDDDRMDTASVMSTSQGEGVMEETAHATESDTRARNNVNRSGNDVEMDQGEKEEEEGQAIEEVEEEEEKEVTQSHQGPSSSETSNRSVVHTHTRTTRKKSMPEKVDVHVAKTAPMDLSVEEGEEGEGDESDEDEETVQNQVPFFHDNLPEHIIFCVDVSDDMSALMLNKQTKMEQVKRALESFVTLKSNISDTHSFGIVCLRNQAFWFSDGMKSGVDIRLDIQKLAVEGHYDSLDLNSLFKQVTSMTSIVTRLICVIGRRIPAIPFESPTCQEYLEFMQSTEAFFDGVIIHERLSPTNMKELQEWADFWQVISGKGHILPVSRAKKDITAYFWRLIGHGLQRAAEFRPDVLLTYNDEQDE